MQFKEVQKPARYAGGEFGVPPIDKNAAARFCLCFPDIYEVGMSNLGVRILYYMLNDTDGVSCERCFAPADDYRRYLNENGIMLHSLETQTPLNKFDILGFSLPFELCYTNVLYMLDLAGIPLKRQDRNAGHPLIIFGGMCTVNAAPMHAFADLIFVGESEESLKAFALLCKDKTLSREELVKKACEIEGVYAPGLLAEQSKVKRAFVRDLDKAYFPSKAIVSNLELVHDRAVTELFRGCANGCRFCQAGFICRPVRERSVENLAKICKELINFTGYDELSMNSLSTGDYSGLKQLITALKPVLNEKRVQLSLPSLRLDSFEGEMAEQNRLSSLTFAPEAGTQRLRDVVNKNITGEDILSSIDQAFERGYDAVKLYFMLGLPTETMEDVEGIAELVNEIKKLYASKKKRRQLRISVSAATFIPKPHTPFQWEKFVDEQVIRERQMYLRDKFKIKNVSFSWSDYKTAVIEAVLARGDERLAEVLEKAYHSGSVFDGWTEHFDFARYEAAFNACGINPQDYLRERRENEALPWDFVDTGISKRFLLEEKKKAYSSGCTPSCYEKCSACGLGKVCYGGS